MSSRVLSPRKGLSSFKSSQWPHVHLNRASPANLAGKTFTRLMVAPHTGHFNESLFMGPKTACTMPEVVGTGVRLDARGQISSRRRSQESLSRRVRPEFEVISSNFNT